jgi:hypothetical protein
MNAAATPAVCLESFEAGSIDPDAFDHEAHIYVAWLYLERYPVTEAIDRFTAALRRLTAKLGVPGKYHETITWFFLLLIAERRAAETSGGWFAFRRENDDICQGAATLRRYYSSELLASRRARENFLLPNRLAS